MKFVWKMERKPPRAHVIQSKPYQHSHSSMMCLGLILFGSVFVVQKIKTTDTEPKRWHGYESFIDMISSTSWFASQGCVRNMCKCNLWTITNIIVQAFHQESFQFISVHNQISHEWLGLFPRTLKPERLELSADRNTVRLTTTLLCLSPLQLLEEP